MGIVESTIGFVSETNIDVVYCLGHLNTNLDIKALDLKRLVSRGHATGMKFTRL